MQGRPVQLRPPRSALQERSLPGYQVLGHGALSTTMIYTPCSTGGALGFGARLTSWDRPLGRPWFD